MKRDKQEQTGKLTGSIITKGEAFVGCCDGITFGVGEDGAPFHTARVDITQEQQIRWAKANSFFFKTVAEKLAKYAEAIASHKQ